MYAVENEDDYKIGAFLKNSADSNIRDENGEVPLVKSAGDFDSEVAKMLLDNGANPDIQGQGGETPLIVATYRGREKTVKLLLEKGSNVNKKNNGPHPKSPYRIKRKGSRYCGEFLDTPLDIELR